MKSCRRFAIQCFMNEMRHAYADCWFILFLFFFFFNDPPTPEFSPLPLPAPLPISFVGPLPSRPSWGFLPPGARKGGIFPAGNPPLFFRALGVRLRSFGRYPSRSRFWRSC